MQTIWLHCANSRYDCGQAKIQLANKKCEIETGINANFTQKCAANKYSLLKSALHNFQMYSPNVINLQKAN